jgi:plastocyanin
MSAGDGDESTGTSSAGDGDGDSSDSTGTGTSGDGDGDSLNDCTFERAQDLRGMPTVTISDISEWTVGHHACIIVDAGTSVRWESMSFDAHGLLGGEAGMLDPDSPITAAGPGSGSTPIEAMLTDVGTYPYYCELHPMNMFGVIYVV